MSSRAALLGMALLVCAACLNAQTHSSGFRIGAVWMDQYPVVNATVECIPSDAAQRPCDAPKDLVLIEEGGVRDRPAEIQVLSETKTGTALVLALDASGSMRGRPIAAIRRALAGFAERARPQDQISILTFADDVRIDAPFGADRSPWARVLQSIQTRCCQTHLYDALSQSFDLLQRSELPPVRRLVVVTDGKDEGSQKTRGDVIAKAKSNHVAVDAIGISRVEPIYLQSLARIASETGGVFRRAQNDADLERMVDLGISQLLSARLATFRLSHVAEDGGLHTVSVAEENASWQQSRELQMPTAKPISVPAIRPRTQPLLIAGCVILMVLGIVFAAFLLRQRARRQAVEAPPASQSDPSGSTASRSEGPPVPFGAPRVESPPALTAPSPTSAAAGRRAERHTVMLHRFEEPRLDRPSAWLSQIAGKEDLVYALIKTRTWFGTAPSATIQLPEDSGALPMHACLEFEDGTFYLSSESLAAKVRVEDEEFARSRRLVLPGNKITVGNAVFRMDLIRPASI